MLRSRLAVVVLALVLASVVGTMLTGCPPKQPERGGRMPPPPPPPMGEAAVSGKLQIVGSTTVLPISQGWLKPFNEKYPQVEVAISGGGSGTGIKQLIGKNTDIANSSRDIKDEEMETAKGAGVDVVEHIVAYDGIAVIVHPDNPLSEFSLEQISGIYTGKVRKWEDLGGGMRGEIQVISRDSASGTYESFKEMAIQLHGKEKDRDYAPATLKQQSNAAIREMVARNRTSIGYVGLGYLDSSVKVVGIIPSGGGAGVKPRAETVRDKSYPIARALYCYTNGQPQGAVKAWLDFGMSAEGQKIVEEAGFIPVQ